MYGSLLSCSLGFLEEQIFPANPVNSLLRSATTDQFTLEQIRLDTRQRIGDAWLYDSPATDLTATVRMDMTASTLKAAEDRGRQTRYTSIDRPFTMRPVTPHRQHGQRSVDL
jgi:hypothetical protein